MSHLKPEESNDASKKYKPQEYLSKSRSHEVIQSKELIQSKIKLTKQENRIINICISKLKPHMTHFEELCFDVSEYLKICGLADSAENHESVRKTFERLRDTSIWVPNNDMSETELSWFDSVTVNNDTGKITFKFSDTLIPHILQFRHGYTSCSLFFMLAFTSKYSFRLYEYAMSYLHTGGWSVEIDTLKKQLGAKCRGFGELNRTVLQKALLEINEYSDINLSYSLEKKGQTYVRINFSVEEKKDIDKRIATVRKIEEKLNH